MLENYNSRDGHMIDVVAAIMISDKEEIFIAQRDYPEQLSGKWEFPGGKIEDNETPQESLTREMKEELGIEINIDQFFEESVYDYDFAKVRIRAYLCQFVSGEIELRDHNASQWVDLNNLNKYEFVPADIKLVDELREAKNEVFSSFSE